MLDIMAQAKNAIEAYNTALKIHSSNIANMNVIGYKKLSYSFQSIFEKLLRGGTAADLYQGLGGTNPMQLGQGMALARVGVDFSQGNLGSGQSLDLAIIGQGLFVVSPDGGKTFQYTRAGQFSITSDGNLVTSSGMQVYGINTSTGSLEPVSGITSSLYDLTKLSWTSDGQLAEFTDTTWATVNKNTNYKIALTYFDNPSGLEQSSGTTFRESSASGEPAAAIASGGAAGTVTPRNNEQSNVFYLGETIDSMEVQRAMSANLTVVRLASDTITEFINKLG
ncbi:MAG: flagellar hook basal-body protein [Candidatus Saganbacteria bacterium]|nr:flagellar hook basal-body protein [Candidatus Saganbacteria bacterium]